MCRSRAFNWDIHDIFLKVTPLVQITAVSRVISETKFNIMILLTSHPSMLCSTLERNWHHPLPCFQSYILFTSYFVSYLGAMSAAAALCKVRKWAQVVISTPLRFISLIEEQLSQHETNIFFRFLGQLPQFN